MALLSRTHLLAGLTVGLLTTAAHAKEEQKTLTLPTTGLSALRIDAGSGHLHIQGVPGLETIEVVAEIIDAGSHYRLSLEKSASAAVLTSHVTAHSGFGGSARIDLTIKVPNRLLLDIDDDSGEIRLAGMRNDATIDDDSGAIVVRDHQGKLEIDDDSGEIEVSGVQGDVDIDDDSGELSVTDVVGNLSVRDDSGPITIKNIAGHVDIDDGSGPITVANVKRGLTIRNSGSGGLSTANIEGGVDIRR